MEKRKYKVLHAIPWIGDRGSEKTCLNAARTMTEFEHVFIAKQVLSQEALDDFMAVGTVIFEDEVNPTNFFEYSMITNELLEEHQIDILALYLPGDDVPNYVKSLNCKKILHILCTKQCNPNDTEFDAVLVLSEHAATLNPDLNPQWVYPSVECIEPTATKEEVLQEYFPDSGPNTIVVSRIGSIETVKHVEDSLKVAASLQHIDNLVFIIAGIGDPRYVDRLFNQYRLPNLVYVGRVSEQEKANINAASSVCLYPTEFESFGFSLAEPMAHGVPVITYNESACPETVGNGGIAVDYNSLTQLSLALVNIITRPLYQKKLSENAKTRWTENYRPGLYAEKITEIYKRVLNDNAD